MAVGVDDSGGNGDATSATAAVSVTADLRPGFLFRWERLDAKRFAAAGLFFVRGHAFHNPSRVRSSITSTMDSRNTDTNVSICSRVNISGGDSTFK